MKAIGQGFHTKPSPTLGSLPASLKFSCVDDQFPLDSWTDWIRWCHIPTCTCVRQMKPVFVSCRHVTLSFVFLCTCRCWEFQSPIQLQLAYFQTIYKYQSYHARGGLPHASIRWHHTSLYHINIMIWGSMEISVCWFQCVTSTPLISIVKNK